MGVSRETSEFLDAFDQESIEQAEIQMKYEGYLEKERQMVDKMNKLDEVKLTHKLDYEKITSLSIEARQKLAKVKPDTLGQASRISGVSPADIAILMVHIGR